MLGFAVAVSAEIFSFFASLSTCSQSIRFSFVQISNLEEAQAPPFPLKQTLANNYTSQLLGSSSILTPPP